MPYPGMLFDLLIVVILALFMLLGARHGMILTLFGLCGVVVAIVGANLIANALAPVVAQALEPRLSAAVAQQLGEALAESTPTFELATGADSVLDGLLGMIQSTDLYQSLVESMTQAVDSGIEQVGQTLGAVIAKAIAQSVAHMVLLILGFVLILFLWNMAAQLLNLACRLPVLRSFNRLGGAVLGLVKGGVICLAVVWLLAWLGFVDREAAEGSYLLIHFARLGPIGSLLV